jgi:hypothetical protein
MADLPSDKVDEAKQVFDVFDKKYEVRIFIILKNPIDRNIVFLQGKSRFILYRRYASFTWFISNTS